MDNVQETTPPPPLVQTAQKCAWCGYYLLGSQILALYDGSDPDYKDWICHAECNLNN